MSTDIITVYHKGSGILLHKEVAEKFKLSNGNIVQDDKLCQVMIANAEFGLSKIHAHTATDKAKNAG